MENRGKGDRYRKIKQGTSFLGYCAAFFLLSVLQTTWIEGFRIFGGVPFLPLTLLVCLSLNKNPIFSLGAGAVCGLFLDLAGGEALGFSCLFCTYISAGCVWLKNRFFLRKIHRVCFCVFGCVLLYGFAAAVLCGIQRGGFSFSAAVPNALLSGAATPMFYGLFPRREVVS